MLLSFKWKFYCYKYGNKRKLNVFLVSMQLKDFSFTISTSLVCHLFFLEQSLNHFLITFSTSLSILILIFKSFLKILADIIPYYIFRCSMCVPINLELKHFINLRISAAAIQLTYQNYNNRNQIDHAVLNILLCQYEISRKFNNTI